MWNRIRNDFNISKKYVYLANAAASPIPKQVYENVIQFYGEFYSNADILWDNWLRKIADARREVAQFIGAERDEIAFTHSTSEGMNIIAHMISKKGIVILNELEFPSTNLPWINRNANTLFIKAERGIIPLKSIEYNIKPMTKTIVTSHVQYATGFRQDLKRLGIICNKKRLYYVVNATQSLGALHFNVKDFNIDFMVSSGHKWLLSSYGIGILYVKRKYLRDSSFRPAFFGHLGQQRVGQFENKKINMSNTASRFELGSPHFPNIISLHAAIGYISKIGIKKIEKRILSLIEYAIDRLQTDNLHISSPLEKEQRSGILIVRLKNAERITAKLQKKGIIVSARGDGIRISPHFYNNEEDIDKFMSSLKQILSN